MRLLSQPWMLRPPLAELASRPVEPSLTPRPPISMLQTLSRRRYARLCRTSSPCAIAMRASVSRMASQSRVTWPAPTEAPRRSNQKTVGSSGYRLRIRGIASGVQKTGKRAATKRAGWCWPYAALETDDLADALAAIGNVTVHTVPWPSCESIEILPPFNSIARIANGRPSPLPFALVV
jgi:hypothetical protein